MPHLAQGFVLRGARCLLHPMADLQLLPQIEPSGRTAGQVKYLCLYVLIFIMSRFWRYWLWCKCLYICLVGVGYIYRATFRRAIYKHTTYTS